MRASVTSVSARTLVPGCTASPGSRLRVTTIAFRGASSLHSFTAMSARATLAIGLGDVVSRSGNLRLRLRRRTPGARRPGSCSSTRLALLLAIWLRSARSFERASSSADCGERPALHELLDASEIDARELLLRLEDIHLRLGRADVLRRARRILRRGARIRLRSRRFSCADASWAFAWVSAAFWSMQSSSTRTSPVLTTSPSRTFDLRDARCDAARDVDVNAFDDAAAAGGPVLGRTEMPHAEHERDEQARGKDADEDQSALHDARLATSRPVACSMRTCATRWSMRAEIAARRARNKFASASASSTLVPLLKRNSSRRER